MISSLLMENKHLSECEKEQIVAYSNCRQSLHDIAEKLNQHHSLIDVFFKNYKKTGNDDRKEECCGRKTKTTAFGDTKIV